jgi:hypothetical protein
MIDNTTKIRRKISEVMNFIEKLEIKNHKLSSIINSLVIVRDNFPSFKIEVGSWNCDRACKKIKDIYFYVDNIIESLEISDNIDNDLLLIYYKIFRKLFLLEKYIKKFY